MKPADLPPQFADNRRRPAHDGSQAEHARSILVTRSGSQSFVVVRRDRSAYSQQMTGNSPTSLTTRSER